MALAVVVATTGLMPIDASAAGGGGSAAPTAPPSSPPSSLPAPSAPSATDVLTADRDAVRSRISDVESQMHAAEVAAAAAQGRVEAAEAAASEASSRSGRAARAARSAAKAARRYAIEAYVRPPAQDALSAAELSEATDAAYATGILKIVADQRRQVVDTMVAAQAVADRDAAAAASASAAARAEVDRARAEVASLQAARAQGAGLAAQLDDRLDAALAEAASLRRVDAKVADDLAAQEVALRSSGPQFPPGSMGRPRATTVAAPATTAPSTARPGTAPSTTVRPITVPSTAAPPTTVRPTTVPPSGVPGIVTWSDVVKVGGIWVNRSIASDVAALLAAARADGINLGGGGYRDPAGQIAVRTANCGTSDYAIYQMPASQCTPPTARPGTSMHERGLAMDLQSSGRLISSRSDPAFVWLAANAARFGFYNLPSEPWHWSTNGS